MAYWQIPSGAHIHYSSGPLRMHASCFVFVKSKEIKKLDFRNLSEILLFLNAFQTLWRTICIFHR